MFEGLGKYGAILADPPWTFQTWSQAGKDRSPEKHYGVMSTEMIAQMPVNKIAADDAVLFLWTCWPQMPEALEVVRSWGFRYKTCAFSWTKAHARQIEMFQDDIDGQVGMGYWIRSNTEPCLLATKGNPKRLHADVRQAIIAPRREHSRKPEGVHKRIERLVAGPYLELFARQRYPGWDCWGNETEKFSSQNLTTVDNEFTE